jgi:hypothetical protein
VGDARQSGRIDVRAALPELVRHLQHDQTPELREARFGHEAPTIQAEEASGFYGFERPRIYGRN